MRIFAFVVAVFAGTVCLPSTAYAAKKIPLSDAQYSGSVEISSKMSVSVSTTTFDPAPQTSSSLASAGGVYIPVFRKVNENFFFTPADQQEFARILQNELIRLSIFEESSSPGDDGVKISLNFKDSTLARPNNEYTLTIEMILTDSDNRRFETTYLVNSNEKSTGWKKMNTSVWQGKMQAAQIALDKLIPDIQLFLNQAP